MEIKRRRSRLVKIGKVLIGAGNPVAIQSMTKCKTSDVDRIVDQIKQLEYVGCQVVRLAIKDSSDAVALGKIKKYVKLPLIADIHFDWRLAVVAMENGADKIRLNPGNIDKQKDLESVVAALKVHRVPLRIGLNSGSVKDIGHRSSSMTDKLVTSCMAYIRRIEKLKFNNIVISLKANNVLDTIESYRKIAKLCAYPLHLGVTATGSPYGGIIKSSVAIGALLLEGIGDTIRVSLTDNPVEEVKAAKCILESLDLLTPSVQIISCPTCGRCGVDLINIVKKLEGELVGQKYKKTGHALKMAVMGCVVNGPGEAKEADIGVAFGKRNGLLFKKGIPVKKVSFKNCASVLLKEIKRL